MAIAPLDDMTMSEIRQYVEKLEDDNRILRRKTRNGRKLDYSDVRRLREMHQSGVYTQRELAESFDLNPATVSRILAGTYYRAVI